MANYSVNIVHWLQYRFNHAVLRNPSTPASGGVNVVTNNKDAATDTGDGLGHVLRSPAEAFTRALAMINNDRSKNGD